MKHVLRSVSRGAGLLGEGEELPVVAMVQDEVAGVCAGQGGGAVAVVGEVTHQLLIGIKADYYDY